MMRSLTIEDFSMIKSLTSPSIRCPRCGCVMTRYDWDECLEDVCGDCLFLIRRRCNSLDCGLFLKKDREENYAEVPNGFLVAGKKEAS